ncbi:Protein AF-9 [Araneus ventricosus]|uniref:Protein AF-9 n=1 Tax=Araneus ventricosus TaxID=182803 RepID=A0A4Y2NZ85_ARAVE|nr:Protein AF-9 [Araneus ventricosus]
MNLEVKIEIRSIVKKMTSQLSGNTHNFTVLVRGLNGNQIEHFVKQVVFYLPFNSSNPKEVKRTPPYLISGSTHASFRLPIDIFLHTSEARNKVRYSYYVFLPDKPVENAVNVKTLTFLNTPQDFRERLLRGGAEVVNQTKSEEVPTQVKREPVEIIENQNEPLGNEPNAEFKVVANKVAADSENTSKKNDEHLVCKTEPTEGADIQNEIQNELPDTCAQSKDISEQKNEILKKENETLFNKFSKQEGVIATYVEKLPVLQDDFSAVSTELGHLQKKAEANEAEISSLKSSIQTLTSEIRQHNNKVDEVQGQIKRRKKSSVSAQGK